MTKEELRIKAVDTALEWTKQIITLAAGILVVSGTFITEIFENKISDPGLLMTCWVSLCVCILTGILYMGSLCSILDKKSPEEVTIYENPSMAIGFIHFASFFIALVFFAVFAFTNLMQK